MRALFDGNHESLCVLKNNKGEEEIFVVSLFGFCV